MRAPSQLLGVLRFAALGMSLAGGFIATPVRAQPVTQFAPLEQTPPDQARSSPDAASTTSAAGAVRRSPALTSPARATEPGRFQPNSAPPSQQRQSALGARSEQDRVEPNSVEPDDAPEDAGRVRRELERTNSVELDARNPNAHGGAELDSAPADDTGSSSTHHLAVSFSVARMFASLYEITAEVRLAERLSIAALAGVGEFEATVQQLGGTIPQLGQTVELGGTVHLAGREFGGQARFYMIGGFDHGVYLGGELLRVWAETSAEDPVQGSGTLTGSGAFLGYKITADFGLTFDAKLGVQKLSIVGEGTATGEVTYMGQTQILSASDSIDEQRTLPLFNVNLGWAI